MNRYNDNIQTIYKLRDQIKTELDKMDISNKDRLLKYRLDDLINLELKECLNCHRLFLPDMYNNNQKFCSHDCLYRSTKATRKYKVSNDLQFRQIDNLRKAIYEKRYRAKISKKELSCEDIYNGILENLSELKKVRHNMTKSEFDKSFNELKMVYKQAGAIDTKILNIDK